MGVERLPVREFVLDELRRNQDQLMSWIALGFVCGFVLGAVMSVCLIALR